MAGAFPRVVRCYDEVAADAERLGGKGAQLLALTRAGLPVPPWFCLTTDVGRDASGGGELTAGDAERVLEAFDDLFGPDVLVSVRSSAPGEDSARDSFAGQLRSFLFVPRARLLARVADCLASAKSEGVRAYRRARGLDAAPPPTAVVVQRMVDSRVAGVLFTANPRSGARDEAVVTAGLGLGEGVVEDRVEADTWTLALTDGSVRERCVRRKTRRVVRDPDAVDGTREEEVPEVEGVLPALSDELLARLCAFGRRCAELFGAPQDVEWALDGVGELYLLQSRPITTLDREQIFDNSNIVESYPGLVSPLSFSFARRGYAITFRESSRRAGVPEEVLARNEHVFRNLLALLRGRVYLNVLHWYRLFLFVPGFEDVLPAWERALGLPVRHVQRGEGARFADKARVVWSAFRRFEGLERNVAAFLRDFEALCAEFAERDLDALGAHELFELHEELCRRFLAPYAVSLANDFFTQQLYDRLGRLIEDYRLGDADELRNALLCGEAGVESVEPVRSALRLAERIRADEVLRDLFVSDASPSELWARLEGEAPGDFLEALEEHLRRYGDRMLHELKLETPPVEEDPSLLVASLRNYLRGGQTVATLEERERAIREAAEERVEAGLRGSPLRRRTFRWVLERTRRGVRLRENLRLCRSRSAGMARKIFRALGRRLAAQGLFEAPEDVFWLTVEELEGQLRGTAVDGDARRLVAARRAEWEEYARTPAPPARVVLQGAVGANALAPAAPELADAEGVLRGQGCAPGRVRARARVVLDPRQADLRLQGEVLVARSTDPGWVYLMVAAGALVVERGSLLSHTAIIGRELGVPTVVAVEGATSRIRDGQWVEVDGAAGTVTLLEDEG
ncbi:MAG: hypothetical protein D6731_01160 [Planctomycetota bacterium]|nr:MAG: hypothetical protein D6731_01160 [Planctomycetota bacterium]